MTVRIVKHAFEIIHLLTGENPLQVKFMQNLMFAHSFDFPYGVWYHGCVYIRLL